MNIKLTIIRFFTKGVLKICGNFIKYSSKTPFFYKLADKVVNSISLEEDIIEINDLKLKKGKTTRQMILTGEPPEPSTNELIAKHVKQGMIVFDIGANIGWFTILLSKLVGPLGHVYSFEPEPKLFEILNENVLLNNLKNVSSYQLAISDKVGTSSLTLNPIQDGDNRLNSKILKGEKILVNTTTIDEFSNKNNLKIDFIKMDAQGSEPKIFHGMKNTLKINSEIKIVTEFFASAMEDLGNDPKNFIEYIEEAFSVQEISENKNKLNKLDKEKLLKKKNQSFDLFCYPKNSS